MTQPLTVRDKLHIAVFGSPQFHAKAASTTGEFQPDTIVDGHKELGDHLTELATLFNKTGEYVRRGFPAQTVLSQLIRELPVDQDFQEKLAGFVNDAGEHLLRKHVLATFEAKVRQKNAQVPAKQKPAKTANTLQGERVVGAVKRLNELKRLTGNT